MTSVNKLYNFYTLSYNYLHIKGGCSLRQCSFNESPPELSPKSKIKHFTQYEKADLCFTDKKAPQKKIYIYRYSYLDMYFFYNHWIDGKKWTRIAGDSQVLS